jgi:hypothetical protein
MAKLEEKFNQSLGLNETVALSIDTMEASTADSKEDVTSRQYDLYHVRYGLQGKPVISVASLSPQEKLETIVWKRRDDVNRLVAEDSSSPSKSEDQVKAVSQEQLR